MLIKITLRSLGLRCPVFSHALAPSGPQARSSTAIVGNSTAHLLRVLAIHQHVQVYIRDVFVYKRYKKLYSR
jgi:hypothetical protein